VNREYWEHRYQTKEMSWEKGAPSPGLVDFLAAHPDVCGGDALVAVRSAAGVAETTEKSATRASQARPTVCIPGCGTGHDVREFAKAGFDAFGIDIAPSAISLAREKTNAARLKAEFQLADFLRAEPPQKFDWLFEHTLFCAIQPSERGDYVRAVLRWLKPGGIYLAVNYIITEDNDGPPWPTTRAEQWARFSPRFELRGDWLPRSYPNRRGREWMFWWCLRAATVAKKL
jgi:methyl halide transferase